MAILMVTAAVPSRTPRPRPLRVRRLGWCPYLEAWAAMRAHNAGAEPAEELWLAEHPPVFTLGLAGRVEHLRRPGSIPVLQTERGGQVSYHGPGQLLAYPLLNLVAACLGVRRYVYLLEQALIEVLAEAGLEATRDARSRGVYVDGAKIAAVGIRVQRGRSSHGVALNVHPDLEPFARIDPCGCPGLPVTSLRRLGVAWSLERAAALLIKHLSVLLGYAPLPPVSPREAAARPAPLSPPSERPWMS